MRSQPGYRARWAILAAAGLGAACAGADGAAPAGGRLEVVAGLYPLAEAAVRVGGDEVEVVNLTPAGAEPHDIELTSRRRDRLEDADLVLYLGQGFQPAVEEVAATAGTAVDLLAGLPLVEGEEGLDPHVWLDPELMIRLVDGVEGALARLDPARAGAFAERAGTYRSELRRLAGDYRSGLASCRRRVLVTSHAAFGYLTRRHGLEQEALAGISPESEPSPARLSELVDLIEAKGVTTVFTETLVPPRVAEALAREADVEVAVLNPLEGLTEEEASRGETYVSVMRDNLAALRRGLDCELR